MPLKTKLQILLGIVSYAVWAFMAYADPSLRADFLKFNVVIATGTIGLALRDMPSSSDQSHKEQSQ
jgi:hypothetical protein